MEAVGFDWKRTKAASHKKLDFHANESGISGKKKDRTVSNAVDLDYISSDEYHDKFKHITDNDAVNERIYAQAKAILTHRNGTDREDLWLIDSKTGKIFGKQIDSRFDLGVEYSESLINAISSCEPYSLISVHNHPTNNPPTGSDFVSAGSKKYKFGVVVTHNGKVYLYKSGEKPFASDIFGHVVDKYVRNGYNSYDAYVMTLDYFEKRFDIKWKEL